LTDQLSGKEDAQRIIGYAESIAKESRKALTQEFAQKFKGVPISTVPKLLQESLLSWFSRRDKNVRVTLGSVNTSMPGEVRAVFNGEAKGVQFLIHADAKFTMTGSSPDSPCYFKELIVSVSKKS
jgi:hypothetical protein